MLIFNFTVHSCATHIWASAWQNQHNGICKQRRLRSQLAFYVNLYRAVISPSATLTGRWQPDIDLRRMLGSAWAFAQSDQILRCLDEDSLDHWSLATHSVKTLIRLDGCSGLSGSLLGARAIGLVFSGDGSFDIANTHEVITTVNYM